MPVLLAALLMVQNQAQPLVFNHTATNLRFSYPQTWKVKKVKDDFKFTIPLAESKSTAELDLYAVSFMAAPDVWENAQKYFAEQLRQTIVSQGREEILGVPLMVFKLQETLTPQRKITLSGIIYAATEFKMQFRLTAPEDAFADAEYEFRNALQSITTIDGKLPEPERPGRATEASAGKKKPLSTPDKPITPLGPSGKSAADVIGPVKLECTVANRAVELCAPKGWVLTAKESGVTATHPEIPGEILIQTRSELDSDPANRALMQASLDDLKSFSKVNRREETAPKTGSAGSKFAYVMRQGEIEGKPKQHFHAVSAKNQFYWLAAAQFDGALNAKQLQILTGFFAGASVEIKP